MSPGLRNALWALCGLVAALALSPLFHRAFPAAPADWAITPDAARAIALERARDLGEVPMDASAAVQLRWRRRDAGAAFAWFWQITVVAPGAPISEWLYRVRLAPDGSVLELERHRPRSGTAARDQTSDGGGVSGRLSRRVRVAMSLIAALLAGAVYLRRRHAGAAPAGRYWRVFVPAFGGGALYVLLAGDSTAMWPGLASFTLHEARLVAALLLLLGSFLPMALASSWSYSTCRPGRQGRRAKLLGAFDAVLEGDWQRPIVARAALRGTCSGLLLVALLFLLVIALRRVGAWPLPPISAAREVASGRWFGLALTASRLSDAFYLALFGQLFVVSLGRRRVGRRVAVGAAALLGAFAVSPIVVLSPFAWNIPLWLGISGLFLAIFLRYGASTSLLAYWTAGVVTTALPFAHAPHPWMQFQALLALLIVALPLVVNVRALATRGSSSE